MALSIEEGKARRLAGLRREKSGLTAVQRLHRSLATGRPPASELRTPLAAITAARTLHSDLEARMTAEGLKPAPGDYGVGIAYITPDLSTLGFTPPFAPGAENGLMQVLDGNVMLGLVFGLRDEEASGDDRIVMGARPFITTKQIDAWLTELLPAFRLYVQDLKFDLERSQTAG